ncbi:hypothetical protein M409DRAFT_22328 [Zasmidium cellare ATCC 36951]|uniref:Uncharacterized protein n=1 Tax=Zasmidium cellare ATCC 36951 TaxID=1080233 RepID=A0A6A6CMY8_ZASCE|nr:uncharacterized protein M409DRAFT_22328 [Zasmidium cellare ATCC 36951]KAF2167520.1 hypothetical protein M409DRAFT_22328 [Zasmidium cellare ATCC 36951]
MHPTLTTLTLLATALSYATAQVAPNTQSCVATDHGAFASYGVNIGITWADGAGCDSVYNELSGNTANGITNWQCEADANGNTQLYFNAPVDEGGDLNSALENQYPTVEGGV